MKIEILHFLEGAEKARGITIIIDVFRAFSTACYLFHNEMDAFFTVDSYEEALKLKSRYPDCILVGERNGKMLKGFDFGNSPSSVKNLNACGKSVVLTTSAGTRGLIAAYENPNSAEVLTGSFVNAAATANYIKKANPSEVSLVCMGWNGLQRADEDVLCAQYLRGLLREDIIDFDEISTALRSERRTPSFLDLKDEISAPEQDLDLCLSPNRFPFALRAEKRQGLLKLVKISTPF